MRFSFQRPIPRLSPLFAHLALAISALTGVLTAAPDKDPVVDLPELKVSTNRIIPPPESWRYAAAPGFEILSNASDRDTRLLVNRLQRFDHVIQVVWPALRETPRPPTRLILCGRGGKFDEFIPTTAERRDGATASLGFFNKEMAAIVVDVQAKSLQAHTMTLSGASDSERVNDFTDDNGSPASGGNTTGYNLDHEKLVNREYLHVLLGQIEPRLPAWMEEGLAQLFGDIQYDKKSISFGELEDPNLISAEQAQAKATKSAMPEVEGTTPPAGDDAQFNKLFGARTRFLGFDDMFGIELGSPAARAAVMNRWAKQAAALIHFCLFGEKEYQKGLLAFAARSGAARATPEMFKECFGITYDKMLENLRNYSASTDYQYQEFRAKKGKSLIPDFPLVDMRDATQGEIGRLKGEAFLLSERSVRARDVAIMAYNRGERDPELLAFLGLRELAEAHPDRARKFLEAAFIGKTKNVRALLELSRQRLAEASPLVAGVPKKITREQASSALAPLYVAHTQPTCIPDVYRLMATVFSRCDAPLKREELAILDHGIKAFPHDLPLIYDTAVLLARHGFAADAAVCSAHGKKMASSPAARALFDKLDIPVSAKTP